MTTLADVRSAMVYDLPPGTTKQPHWLNAGLLVVAAVRKRQADRIRVATDALGDALDVEGWMSEAAPPSA